MAAAIQKLKEEEISKAHSQTELGFRSEQQMGKKVMAMTTTVPSLAE